MEFRRAQHYTTRLHNPASDEIRATEHLRGLAFPMYFIL